MNLLGRTAPRSAAHARPFAPAVLEYPGRSMVEPREMHVFVRQPRITNRIGRVDRPQSQRQITSVYSRRQIQQKVSYIHPATSPGLIEPLLPPETQHSDQCMDLLLVADGTI